MTRVLADVRKKVPDEIYPATWFDGLLLLVDPTCGVYDLSEAREQVDTPDRARNLNDRVCPRRRPA